MSLVINVSYLVLLGLFLVCGLVIIYHIVRYSFRSVEAAVALAIFIPVFFVLMMTSFVLFSLINWEAVFSVIY